MVLFGGFKFVKTVVSCVLYCVALFSWLLVSLWFDWLALSVGFVIVGVCF